MPGVAATAFPAPSPLRTLEVAAITPPPPPPPPPIDSHPDPFHRHVALADPPPLQAPADTASVKSHAWPVTGEAGGLANVASGSRNLPAERSTYPVKAFVAFVSATFDDSLESGRVPELILDAFVVSVVAEAARPEMSDASG